MISSDGVSLPCLIRKRKKHRSKKHKNYNYNSGVSWPHSKCVALFLHSTLLIYMLHGEIFI